MINPDSIFKLMEDFINEGMPFEGMERLHRELEDEFYRQFYNTLKKTVELCHCMEEERVPETLHIRVIERIQKLGTDTNFQPPITPEGTIEKVSDEKISERKLRKIPLKSRRKLQPKPRSKLRTKSQRKP